MSFATVRSMIARNEERGMLSCINVVAVDVEQCMRAVCQAIWTGFALDCETTGVMQRTYDALVE